MLRLPYCGRSWRMSRAFSSPTNSSSSAIKQSLPLPGQMQEAGPTWNAEANPGREHLAEGRCPVVVDPKLRRGSGLAIEALDFVKLLLALLAPIPAPCFRHFFLALSLSLAECIETLLSAGCVCGNTAPFSVRPVWALAGTKRKASHGHIPQSAYTYHLSALWLSVWSSWRVAVFQAKHRAAFTAQYV